MIKVLFIFPAYKPAWKYGGIVSCTSSLCESLVEIGAKVAVFTTNISGGQNPIVPINHKKEIMNGVEVHYHKSDTGYLNANKSTELINHLKSSISQFDLVYLSAVWQMFGLEVMDICHANSTPCIFAPHGSFSTFARKKSFLKKNIYFHYFIKKRLKHIKKIHFTSQAEKDFCKNWAKETPYFILPNIIKCNDFKFNPDSREKIRNKYNIHNDEFVITSITRPDRIKRIDLAIQAIAKIDNLKFIIITDTNNNITKDWIKLSKKLNLENKTIWPGEVTPQDIKEILSASDTLVHMSESENFSMVIGEAVSNGLPVIFSNNVGIKDFLQNKNFAKIIPLNAEHLRKAICEIKVKQTLTRTEISKVAENLFSPKNIAKKFINESEKLIYGN